MIPLSPGIIALAPLTPVISRDPEAILTSAAIPVSPEVKRLSSSQQQPAAPREADTSDSGAGPEIPGPGARKKQETVAETCRVRRAVEDVTCDMGDTGQMSAPRVTVTCCARPAGSADCWVAGKPSLADEFPVTSSRSIPGPGSLLQSRSAVSRAWSWRLETQDREIVIGERI